jgi:cyclopropane fatty-acyl-phospholipid synthase-like methyltransferase
LGVDGIMSGRFSYGLSYRLGLAFWDTFDTDRVLADLIEGPAALPAGRALDLGCGTGRNSVYLARHGWNVTGVDLVEHAITQARARAVAEGMPVRFVHGDITRLDELGVGDRYTLLVDFGCFHSVPVARRDAYAAAVTKVAAPEAILWMWGLGTPSTLREIRPCAGVGVTADELRARFPGWHLTSADPVSREELRHITRHVRLVWQPVRALMKTRWIPRAWRFQLTRDPTRQHPTERDT